MSSRINEIVGANRLHTHTHVSLIRTPKSFMPGINVLTLIAGNLRAQVWKAEPNFGLFAGLLHAERRHDVEDPARRTVALQEQLHQHQS